MTLFYSFLKNYSTSASNIFREAFYYHYLQTCKFNVNLWTLYFVLQKEEGPTYPDLNWIENETFRAKFEIGKKFAMGLWKCKGQGKSAKISTLDSSRINNVWKTSLALAGIFSLQCHYLCYAVIALSLVYRSHNNNWIIWSNSTLILIGIPGGFGHGQGGKVAQLP